ncbi:MAG: betaine/proline/choline family ABC transporter ATP-binding protein [Firmicutes bacterium]|nr:betaine/proline/choline family ABC transporter ATP-binding protein [Bacillota bacterium]MDD4263214.1 betaine/proline/choline family ABC transporter ATP-binding protein [Bacillota bacterium]MDD4693310.1 betaine/proline/choline family ABC transporter ATP-binding protein [Bacillota bacterium]
MLEIKNLTKVFGEGEDSFVAVNKINLKVNQGEFVVLIGPSGCGKTTTLKMINHLVEPTSGDILINGTSTKEKNVVELRRAIGYVIQNIGLFPHLTIAANVEIVPKLNKMDKVKRRKKTFELLEMVGLDPDIYANRYPTELSGGQQQRIGVLRALAADQDLILMDEPFGALDPITRVQLQDEMKDLQKRLDKTIIFVTHDIDEAIKVADKIVLMKDGKIVQAASPKEMLKEPANEYVREFIGEERLVPEPDTTPVSEVMVLEPLIVNIDSTAKNVFKKMQKYSADIAVAVDDNKRFTGLVSANQIQIQQRKNTTLQQIIQGKPQSVRSNTTIRDAAETLANETRVLCVVDKKQRPVGLVSRTTLLRGIVDIWDESNAG